MSTTWEQASKCPIDGTTGKVIKRKPQSGGQLITLECQQTRCQYHDDGWVVSVRPDNTIPDPVPPSARERLPEMSLARRAQVLAKLEQQMLDEQKPGTEVPRY